MKPIRIESLRLATQFRRDLRPNRLPTVLATGVVTGLLAIILGISLAILIFSGEMEPYASTGIGLLLVGNVVVITLIALLSSHSAMVPVSQDGPGVVLAVAVAALIAGFPTGMAAETKLVTVIATLVVTNLATGLFFLLLGVFKLGDLVRYIPFPVVGGFLAGTGWLLAQGGIGVITGGVFGVEIFQMELLSRWLPGLAVGMTLLIALRRFQQSYVLPAIFAGAIALFYLIVALRGLSIAQVSAGGWLLGPFPEGALWHLPITPQNFGSISWADILGQAAGLAPVLVVSVLMLLLNISGLELVVGDDIDLNRELVVAGAANLAGGFGGGSVGFHSISYSSLNHRLSGGSRLATLLTAGLCALPLLAGPAILQVIPKFVPAGLLIYLGLSFLYEWVIEARHKLPLVEYAVIPLILAVIAGFGFIAGTAVGIITAVILFVINYSRIDIVKYALDGRSRHSRFSRSGKAARMLKETGDKIYILQLQGYIFFGTANRLSIRVRERILEHGDRKPEFVLLDFRMVSGMDSTAIFSFIKMKNLTQEQGIKLLLTGISPESRKQFEKNGLIEQPDSVLFFTDFDRGIEWCEERLLLAAGVTDEIKSLEGHLQDLLPGFQSLEPLMRHFTRQIYQPGEYLFRQGDEPDAVFFLESGQVTAQLEVPDRPLLRLETIEGGRMVGEIGFYLGVGRTASVVVDKQAVIYRISRADLAAIARTDPVAAALFHEIIAHLLADRLTQFTRAVEAMLR